MTKFEEQARSFGAKFSYEEVTSIVGYSKEEENNKPTKNYFKIKTSGNNEYLASAVILAFGKTPRDLNVPGEQQFKGKGVSYCAVCKYLISLNMLPPSTRSRIFNNLLQI